MTAPATAAVDVTGRVPIEGAHHVAAWIVPPPTTARRVPLLFCLPGGSYTKAYWHLEVPGHPGYSFAEHLAAQGMLVIAVDHLGTGESSRHPRVADLTPEVVAAANAVVLGELAARAAAGTLVPGLGPCEIGPVVGVGHSMGGMLAIIQQSLHHSFDAIAPLGYGVAGPIHAFGVDDGGRSTRPTLEGVMAAARAGEIDGAPAPDRRNFRHLFYWDDVPAEVVAADDRTATNTPGVTGRLAVVPSIVTNHAGRVTCPVFLGFGVRDSVDRPRDEPGAYASSNDVTLFVLEGSAHCHNSAGSRHVLWDRLARWVRTLPPAPARS